MEDERYVLQAPMGYLILGVFVLVPPGIACLHHATELSKDPSNAALFVILGALFLLPVAVGGVRALGGKKDILLEAHSITVPRLSSPNSIRFQWATLQPLEVRAVHAGPKLFRSVWLRDGVNSIEIPEIHVGGPANFQRLVASMQARMQAARGVSR